MLQLPKQFLKRVLRMIGNNMGLHEIASEIKRLRETVQQIQYQTAVAPDGLPLPPPELYFLITGRRDLDTFDFLESGRAHAAEVVSTLSRHGIEIDELEAILDFGCGCGRVTRHFHFLKKAKVYGTDYNRRLIDWCRQCLQFAEFETNELSPPLAYRDAQFDLIYAFSVFTHLTESLQQGWLAELSRVLKPGGHLFLTTHGVAFAEELLPRQAKEQFAAGRLVIMNPELAPEGCAAFHPYLYVKETLAKRFELQDFYPGAVVDRSRGFITQDSYFLRKPD
jgi:SAM-dependent methyltransferase